MTQYPGVPLELASIGLTRMLVVDLLNKPEQSLCDEILKRVLMKLAVIMPDCQMSSSVARRFRASREGLQARASREGSWLLL